MSNVLQRILVPTDGSKAAETALTLAIRLARRHHAEIIVCNTVDYVTIAAETSVGFGADLAGMFEALDDGAKEVIGAAVKRLKHEGFDATGYKLDGHAASTIVSFAMEKDADAIVMGTRGLGGLPHLVLGSTAEGVLRMATVPVFVVHADAQIATFETPTIVVAVDDSDPGDAAEAFATELAAVTSGRLVFENVIDSESLYEYAARYGTSISGIHQEWEAEAKRIVGDAAYRAAVAGVANIEKCIVFGEPAEKIVDNARAAHADLIAIGTHGRRGLRRLALGSVAEGVVRKSAVPVVVVRAYAELKSGRSADRVDTRAELISV